MNYWQTQHGVTIYQVAKGRSNAFLIQINALNILVDTSAKRYFRRLQQNLERLSVQKIDYLVLTHSHYDHAENAEFIKSAYGARVIIHQSEADYLQQGINILPKGTTRVTRFLTDHFGERYLNHFNYTPCQAAILVDDQFEIPETNGLVRLIHTPGHTRGCLSLIVDDEIALVGDAMFGVFPGSIFPPYGNDIQKIVTSWRKLIETPCKLFIPAHGSANKRDMVQKCYNQRKEKST